MSGRGLFKTMAIICRDFGLLFIMTPRTACTAIGDLLCTQFGGEYLPKEDILNGKGRIAVQKKHCTLSELIENGFLNNDDARSLLKFAAVRNPFDTLVSLYWKQRSKYQPLLEDPASWVNRIGPLYAKNMRYAQTHSFNQWVLRKCRRQLIKRLFGFRPSMFFEYTRGVNIVLRYESIEKDLQGVLTKAGITTKAQIPSINRTEERKERDYRACYTRLSTAAVRLAFSNDFKSYGYHF
jgi:hypothetical protein